MGIWMDIPCTVIKRGWEAPVAWWFRARKIIELNRGGWLQEGTKNCLDIRTVWERTTMVDMIKNRKDFDKSVFGDSENGNVKRSWRFLRDSSNRNSFERQRILGPMILMTCSIWSTTRCREFRRVDNQAHHKKEVGMNLHQKEWSFGGFLPSQKTLLSAKRWSNQWCPGQHVPATTGPGLDLRVS